MRTRTLQFAFFASFVAFQVPVYAGADGRDYGIQRYASDDVYSFQHAVFKKIDGEFTLVGSLATELIYGDGSLGAIQELLAEGKTVNEIVALCLTSIQEQGGLCGVRNVASAALFADNGARTYDSLGEDFEIRIGDGTQPAATVGKIERLNRCGGTSVDDDALPVAMEECEVKVSGLSIGPMRPVMRVFPAEEEINAMYKHRATVSLVTFNGRVTFPYDGSMTYPRLVQESRLSGPAECVPETSSCAMHSYHDTVFGVPGGSLVAWFGGVPVKVGTDVGAREGVNSAASTHPQDLIPVSE